jgi:hypothetical protein
MNTQKTIFNKLFSSKTNLKRNHKVSLSKLDELLEQAYQSSGNYSYALDELFYPGREKLIGSRDVLRFEEPRPSFVQAQLDDIKSSLDELGLDYPDSVNEVQDAIDSAVESFNELREVMENLGINPMVDRE